MASVLTEALPIADSRVTRARLADAYREARAQLLSLREGGGHWAGELSSSALSTATAVCALLLTDERQHATLARGGVRWLLDQQNDDGGWGDTTRSFSNISTTMLCRAALTLWEKSPESAAVVSPSSERSGAGLRRAESYLLSLCGGLDSATLARAVRERYGKDHTFSVPILSCCALAGLVGWDEVPALPFELACFPASAYRRLNLPVVSYALPALISLGLLIHERRPPSCPVTCAVRRAAAPRALRKLEAIQPANGGFLEAAPLVSFVTMGLAGAGLGAHPVARRCVEFLQSAVRADGSWPIDTNLATWVTTLSINALAGRGGPRGEMAGEGEGARDSLRRWLLGQQYRSAHPFTSAAPGGWGWTPLPGAVPDADDTAGALIALHNLGATDESSAAAVAGLRWLLDLQNRDGGFPTFCRGWGYLPFDRSSSDITAHALRALKVWAAAFDALPPSARAGGVGAGLGALFGSVREKAAFLRRIRRAVEKGVNYLERAQRADGSWLPLWFGNQHAHDDENPTYGTARVLAAFRDLGLWRTEAARRGWLWLVASQHESGGWGGAADTPPSVEETALAVEALTDGDAVAGGDGAAQSEAVTRGLCWLVERVEDGSYLDPSPVGFYFAKLWYFEKLYPLVFTVGALGRALRHAESGGAVLIQSETPVRGIYV